MKNYDFLNVSDDSSFSRVKVVVVGDIILDEYTMGTIERLSPEAPVPVVIDRERRYILGGAANVAHNVAALGGKVSLIGVVGRDVGGKIIKKICKEKKISDRLVVDPVRRTTIKNRIIVNHHQVLRIDTEYAEKISEKIEKKMLRQLTTANADIVIFSDYAKGAITKKLVVAAKKKFGAHRVLADFKPSRAECFIGVGMIFPNLKEAYELTGIRADTKILSEKVVALLAKQFGSSVVFKRSEYGMTLYEKGKEKPVHLPAQTREVFDVTGAGDTVIAVMALALVVGATFVDAAKIANHAAGVVIEKEGTAVVSFEELLRKIDWKK